MYFLKNTKEIIPQFNCLRYKSYRNNLCILLKVSKRNFYQNYFSKNASNIKNIWSGIKEIINLNKRGTRGIPTISKDNNLV